ncbi:MAG TPA: hypothetical protein VM098_03310 [Phycisphaerae bacterium]|nr:hypothetical protein [Phycisphaerae bacterium]
MKKNLIVLMIGAAVSLLGSSALSAADTESMRFPGVRCVHRHTTIPREIDMHIVLIDLNRPGVTIKTTGPNGDPETQTDFETTRQFVKRTGAQIGINGGFFGYTRKAVDTAKGGLCSLAVSDGRLVCGWGHNQHDAANIGTDNTIIFDRKPPFHYVCPCRQNFVKFAASERMEHAVLDCRQEQLSLPGGKVRGHGDATTMPVDIRHYRHIVFLKPDLFVIFDSIDARFASDWRLHCYAKGVRFEGSHAIFEGNHGIGLDANVVLPAAPAFTTKMVVDTHSMQFANAAGADYLVVLSPREAGTRPLWACDFRDDVLTISVGSDHRRLRMKESDQKHV